MQTIYEPRGRAREYCDLALNLYRGCNHGCTYCYAPLTMKIPREEFYSAEHRPELLGALMKDAKKFPGREVFLCFTCDPYQPIHRDITREAIMILLRNEISVRILTKAGIRSTRDFDLLDGRSHYGTTLTFLSEKDSEMFEPEAAMPSDRLAALSLAKRAGIPTWVSLEPVIDPYQSLDLIVKSNEFVDEYKIGKWNYDKRGKEIDWKWFAREAVRICRKYSKKYYLKADLLKAIGGYVEA